MKGSIHMTVLRRWMIRLAHWLLEHAAVDVTFELRQIKPGSDRQVLGRTISRHEGIDDAVDGFAHTSVDLGHYNVLWVRGRIGETAVNVPYLHGARGPLPATPGEESGGEIIHDDEHSRIDVHPGLRQHVASAPPPRWTQSLNVNVSADGGLHQCNTDGPLIPGADGQYRPSCTICGKPNEVRLA